jgi:hypothetical protein
MQPPRELPRVMIINVMKMKLATIMISRLMSIVTYVWKRNVAKLNMSA